MSFAVSFALRRWSWPVENMQRSRTVQHRIIDGSRGWYEISKWCYKLKDLKRTACFSACILSHLIVPYKSRYFWTVQVVFSEHCQGHWLNHQALEASYPHILCVESGWMEFPIISLSHGQLTPTNAKYGSTWIHFPDICFTCLGLGHNNKQFARAPRSDARDFGNVISSVTWWCGLGGYWYFPMAEKSAPGIKTVESFIGGFDKHFWSTIVL